MELETFRTLRKNRREKLDHLLAALKLWRSGSVERGVRQLLADKISGNLVGLWLLAPEHLREELQLALGCLGCARGHFQGRLLAIDPHRLPSANKRQMPRYRDNPALRPYKVATTFFCLDAETHQPLCFLLASSSMTVTQMTPRPLPAS